MGNFLRHFWDFFIDNHNLKNLADIDWTSIEWQHRIINTCSPEVCMDIISRYTPEMAALASKAVVILERSSRSMNGIQGDNQFLDHNMSIATLPGSQSQLTEQVFELIAEAAERGYPFCLILDNVYRQDCPVIQEDFHNVNLVISNNDVSALDTETNQITRRAHSALLFKHGRADSEERLSERYFGYYQHIIGERNVGGHSETFRPLDRGNNYGVTYRRSRDLRLEPAYFSRLRDGNGFASSTFLGEGVVNITQ